VNRATVSAHINVIVNLKHILRIWIFLPLGITEGRSFIKAFVRRNKTAPLPIEQSTIECESFSRNLTPNVETPAGEKSTQTMTTILDPLNLNIDHNESYANMKLIRPYTAPERSQPNKMTIINIPGQVLQWQHL